MEKVHLQQPAPPSLISDQSIQTPNVTAANTAVQLHCPLCMHACLHSLKAEQSWNMEAHIDACNQPPMNMIQSNLPPNLGETGFDHG